jgi:hypothetical protein
MQVKTSLKAGLNIGEMPKQALDTVKTTADNAVQSVQSAAQTVQSTAQSAAQVLTNPKTYTWPF